MECQIKLSSIASGLALLWELAAWEYYRSMFISLEKNIASTFLASCRPMEHIKMSPDYWYILVIKQLKFH